ncbi:acid protease [Mycena vulgaris]|nr:acid protease [Mycena vulgaris]
MGILVLFSLLSLFSGATRAAFPAAQHVSRSVVLPRADFVVPFTSKAPRRETKKKALRGKYGKARGKTVHLDGAAFENEYLVNITIGGQNFQVIIDTGSSDTWVVHKNFTCFDLSGNSVPAATCDFGPAQFDPAASPTFRLFPNVTFLVRYGSGESLSGLAGFETVSVGGLSISHQEIGVPNHIAPSLGDGVSEGVFGLAFPSLTSVWNTTDARNTSASSHLLYNPFFLNAFSLSRSNRPTLKQEANEPFVRNLGFLAFGGAVPVPVTKTAVTLPVQRYAPNADHIFVPSNATEAVYSYDAVLTKNNNTILDSGTTLNWVPTNVAPTRHLDADSGLYRVSCNATAPPFSVVDSNGNAICISGTQDEGPDVPGNIFILGDVFLHNVVVTHNPVDGEVTLAQRAKY